MSVWVLQFLVALHSVYKKNIFFDNFMLNMWQKATKKLTLKLKKQNKFKKKNWKLDFFFFFLKHATKGKTH